MNYYKLVASQGPGLVCDEAELHGFDPRGLDRGEFISHWDDRITLLYKHGGVEDMLANMVYWPVFSWNFRSILDSLGVQDIQYLPVLVRNSTTGKNLDGYFAANILHRVAALDLRQSKYISHQVDGETVLNVLRYALRLEAVQAYDVLRLDEVSSAIFVSERIKVALELAGVTGCVFREVRVA